MCQSVIFGSLTLRNTNYVNLGGRLCVVIIRIFKKLKFPESSDIHDSSNHLNNVANLLKPLIFQVSVPVGHIWKFDLEGHEKT